jgi:DNA-binding transcriptional MerR regulator
MMGVNISESILVRMFGVTRQRIRYWRKIGLMPPRCDGGRQGYTFEDALTIKIIHALVSVGIQPGKIRSSLTASMRIFNSTKLLTGTKLYVCNKEIFIIDGGKAIVPRTGQYLLFDLDSCRNELEIAVQMIATKANTRSKSFKGTEGLDLSTASQEAHSTKVSAQ